MVVLNISTFSGNETKWIEQPEVHEDCGNDSAKLG